MFELDLFFCCYWIVVATIIYIGITEKRSFMNERETRKTTDYVAFDEVFVISRINCFAVAWDSTIFESCIWENPLPSPWNFNMLLIRNSNHNTISMILLFLRLVLLSAQLFVLFLARKIMQNSPYNNRSKNFSYIFAVCLNIYGIIQLDASDAKNSNELCT